MTTPAVTTARPTRFEAAALMLDSKVNRLPVVDADDKLVGIVTRAGSGPRIRPRRQRDRAGDSDDVLTHAVGIARTFSKSETKRRGNLWKVNNAHAAGTPSASSSGFQVSNIRSRLTW
jgi:CBS-domain-containing membrane protein